MKGCDRWSGIVHWNKAGRVVIMIAFLIISAHAQQSESAVGQSMVLNVYLDNAGKALITGYAEDVSGLAFLNDSQFRFENDSHQLYALTDRLTVKAGDLWTLSFDAAGSFRDYRVTFYLPSEIKLGEINTSQGLGYLLSASNESLVADVQGYEVSDPVISIEYRQQLSSNGSSLPPLPPAYPGEGAALVMLIIAAALLMAGFGFAVFLQRKRRGLMAAPSAVSIEKPMEKTIAAPLARVAADYSSPGKPDLTVPADLPAVAAKEASSEASNAGALSSPEDDGVLLSEAQQEAVENGADKVENSSSSALDGANIQTNVPEDISEQLSHNEVSRPSASEKDRKFADAGAQPVSESTSKVIVVSSEMDAVMQTLTARERAVMSTLIEHGGRMTQAEIRYETGTPKSSLTGILISLERRKLVSKKEWGRTNIIELSDWFLSMKEQS
ncbi:MAG: hypothetical protein A4E49_00646 [Methanosaeta sp. PtaU1.Bin112]|nr:MAG: hypothetical protein A4E49_00646 [Methanosaeta sp. PtaU1.Bin112]